MEENTKDKLIKILRDGSIVKIIEEIKVPYSKSEVALAIREKKKLFPFLHKKEFGFCTINDNKFKYIPFSKLKKLTKESIIDDFIEVYIYHNSGRDYEISDRYEDSKKALKILKKLKKRKFDLEGITESEKNDLSLKIQYFFVDCSLYGYFKKQH